MPFFFTRTGPALILALAVGATAIPAPAFADASPPPHSNGGHQSGGNHQSGRGNQSSAHQSGGNQGSHNAGGNAGSHQYSGSHGNSRPAPPAQQFHRPAAPPQQFHRPAAPAQQHTQQYSRPNRPTTHGRPATSYARPNRTWSGRQQIVRNPQVTIRFSGRRIGNPRYSNQSAWSWNRGIRWNQNSSYWGGGFWGPFAIGVALAAAFGIFSYNNQSYYSYQVQPNSPGAQLLNAYQLEQTPCGAPNLVVIWGPYNSVICAWPNNLVGPGTYSVDPQTLTLVSQY